jgi:uncharacterized protein YdaU (DUF1376 family)
MGRLLWYKHDPNAFLHGVAVLTLEETGAYAIIIDAYYAEDGKLPDDDRWISRLMRCDPRTWRRIKKTLIEKSKITVTGGFITVRRGEKTLQEMREFSDLQASRVNVRWRQSERTRNNSNQTSGEVSPEFTPESSEKPNKIKKPPIPSTTTTTQKDIPLPLSNTVHSSELPTPSLAVVARNKAVRATRLPEGWRPDLQTWASMLDEIGSNPADLERVFLNFTDYWVGCGKAKTDWNAVFRVWCRRDFNQPKRGNGHDPPRSIVKRGSVAEIGDRIFAALEAERRRRQGQKSD